MLMRITFGLRLLILLGLTTGICRADEFATITTVLLGGSTAVAGGSSYSLWYTTTRDPNAEEKREDETDTESRMLSVEEKFEAFALRFYQNKRGVRRDLVRGSGPHFDWVLLRIFNNKYRPEQMAFRCLLLLAKPELNALLKTAEAKTALNDRSGTDALVIWLSQIDAESRRIPEPTFNRCALARRYSVFPDRMVQDLTKRRDGVDYAWVTEQYMGLDPDAQQEAKAELKEASLDLKNAFYVAADPETRTQGFNLIEGILRGIAAKLGADAAQTSVPRSNQTLRAKNATSATLPRSEKSYKGKPIKPFYTLKAPTPEKVYRPFNLGLTMTEQGAIQLGLSYRTQESNWEPSIHLHPTHVSLGARRYLTAIGPKASVIEPYIGARTHLWGHKFGLDYRNPTENDPGNRSYADVALSTTFGLSFSRKNRVRLALGYRVFFVQTHDNTRLLELLHGASAEVGFYF